MERKYIIAMGALAAGLLAGVFILAGQRQGMASMYANLSQIFNDQRQWVEIKPRTIDTRPKENIISGNGQADNKAGAAAKTASKTKTAKAQKPVINWCAPPVGHTPQRQVIFNEIAWMGTLASYSDEWVELKNISGQDINLNGWQIQNKNQAIKISFCENDAIPAAKLYLLERTDDNSAPGVTADKTYTGSLGNSDEALYLFDTACQLQDSVTASPKWPAGDNATKQTMQRLPNFLWQTSKKSGGTPGKE
jgi:hypothetical protein